MAPEDEYSHSEIGAKPSARAALKSRYFAEASRAMVACRSHSRTSIPSEAYRAHSLCSSIRPGAADAGKRTVARIATTPVATINGFERFIERIPLISPMCAIIGPVGGSSQGDREH